MTKQKIEWLDAMRGFTMLLVVAYHVALFSFGQNVKQSASLPFFLLFRMPMFFFVSGFLAYKTSFQWTVPNALRMTWNKVKVQIVPTLVFLCIYIVLRQKDFWDTLGRYLGDNMKGGYWFTLVLLQMFVIYYLSCLVARGKSWMIWLLWVVSLVGYETLYMPKIFKYHKADFYEWTSFVETIRYMHFFLMGNLVHRYWGRVQRLFDTPWFFPIVCTVAFVCCADIFRWHTLRFMWTNLPRTVAMYSLVLLIVMFFRHYGECFRGTHPLGRGLQFIGTRTLDVYLLHYIFLPKLPMVGKWLNTYRPNFVVDVVASVGVALAVIAFCLLISQFLRVSPFLRHYLFGRK